MRLGLLEEAVEEAKRFIAKTQEVKAPRDDRLSPYAEPGPEVAACKRASLDLTRALAKMRRG